MIALSLIVLAMLSVEVPTRGKMFTPAGLLITSGLAKDPDTDDTAKPDVPALAAGTLPSKVFVIVTTLPTTPGVPKDMSPVTACCIAKATVFALAPGLK